MRDLAMCQNEAAAYGQSSIMRGEQNAPSVIIDSMAESSRQNKIVKTCMIAKGYSLVGKNSPLLTNNQPTQPISNQYPSHQQISLKLKALQDDVFYADAEARYWGQQVAKIEAGKEWTPITAWDEHGNPALGQAQQPSDAAKKQIQTMIDNCLFVKAQKQERIRQMITDFDNANKKAASDLIGHWESVAFKGKEIGEGLEKLEFDFLPDNQLVITTIQKGKTHVEKGQYTVKGGELLVIPSDTNTAPDRARYSLIGDHLVITHGNGAAEIILQRVQKIAP
jgi:hypothetical protein